MSHARPAAAHVDLRVGWALTKTTIPINHEFEHTFESRPGAAERRSTVEPGAFSLPAELAELLAQPRPVVSSPGFATQVGDPSPGQRRHCYLALQVARSALVAEPTTPQRAVAASIAAVPGARQRSAIARVRLNVRTILTHLPQRTRPVPAEVVDRSVAALSAAEAAVQPRRAGGLFVCDMPGVDTEPRVVMAVEVHPARRQGGTRDGWMSSRVNAHMHLGKRIARSIPTARFGGVVVLTPRCDAAAVHVPAAGAWHGLGSCADCMSFTHRRAGVAGEVRR